MDTTLVTWSPTKYTQPTAEGRITLYYICILVLTFYVAVAPRGLHQAAPYLISIVRVLQKRTVPASKLNLKDRLGNLKIIESAQFLFSKEKYPQLAIVQRLTEQQCIQQRSVIYEGFISQLLYGSCLFSFFFFPVGLSFP